MDFDNIFDGIRENKKTLLIVFGLIVVMIIISLLDLFFNNSADSNVDVAGSLESFAQIYYEESYYPYVHSMFSEEYVNRLKKDGEEGIKLTLRKILNTFEGVSADNFYQKGSYCDFNDTYAIIYPENPYGKDDYKIEVKVSCDKTI